MNKNILFLVLVVLAAVLTAPARALAYNVNGVVDFTYSSYQNKVGKEKSSSHTFTEHYGVNVAGFMLDPRFLRLNAGIGYTRTHAQRSADYSSLNYNVGASFFPGRTISWDLYAAKNTMTVQSSTGIHGYNIDSMNYGVALSLRLSKFRSRYGNNNTFNGNNNNGNNNGDNNSNNNKEGSRRWSSLGFPDIFFTRDHQESESISQQNPLHETRDNTTASILYRINSSVDIHLNAGMEEFKNLRDSSSYDTKTADLLAVAKASWNSELRITGNVNQRTVNNVAGFENTSTRITLLGLRWNFQEQNRLAHNYGYDYSFTEAGPAEYTNHSGFGYVRYAVLPELSLYARVNYSKAEYVFQATGLAPYDTTSMQSGGLSAGATYRKVYSPAFLDPFVLTTTYDFSTGFSKVNTLSEGDQGSGLYYQNSAGLGLVSSGWKYESLSFDCTYVSRRDHSPVNNDVSSQSYRLMFNTQRVPRTHIDGSVSYSSHDSSTSSTAGVFAPTAQGLNQQTRSLDYAASINHTLNGYVNLSAGATQGKSASTSGYTLSTLTSTYNVRVRQLYAQALFNYEFTRDLRLNASLRKEQRRADYASDLDSYLASMTINHRIRAITMSAEWHWREDVTDQSPRIFQQSLMVKVSRPF